MSSQMYLNLLEEARDLHIRKSAAYVGKDPDPWRNFRDSERVGVEAWRGALVRLLDKVNRVCTLASQPEVDPGDETIEDTLLDLSAYALITLCILRGDGAQT